VSGYTLYQAEWCPFSSAVREVLTELGIDYSIRQVEPWPEQRERLRAVAGSDQIPVLQTPDGEALIGTRAIFAHLRDAEPWPFAAAHRRRFADHRDARESDAPGQLVEYFRGTDELEKDAPASLDDAVVADVPAAGRYELKVGGRLIGLLAYRKRDGRVALTHTEVSEACEGRGFGSRLVGVALDDARRQGLHVLPLCPFVAHYIDTHPQYADLVARD
jgi:predicted GNAT family acetyltransferase/glutaredoxin